MKVHVLAVIVKSVNRSTIPRDTDNRVSVKWSLCVKDWGSWPFLVALLKGPDDSLQNTVATWFHRSSADIWSHDTCCCDTKSWILSKCCHFKYTLCVCELVRECKDRQKFDWPPWKFMIFFNCSLWKHSFLHSLSAKISEKAPSNSTEYCRYSPMALFLWFKNLHNWIHQTVGSRFLR